MTVASERPGFFIPYRHAASVRPCAYPALEPIFLAAEPEMLSSLARTERHAAQLHARSGPPPRPRFDQEWFPRLDAAQAYSLVRAQHPGRIVEIGSGHSTRFLAQAIADAGSPTELHCIDPEPRADIQALPLSHHARRLEELDAQALAALLGPGDILFVDSSHLLVPGGDVDRIVNDLLPRLPSGVLLHVHDIFLPDPYPDAWTWRGYAEQSLIAVLLHAGGWRLLWSSHWLATRHAARIAAGPLSTLPLRPGVPETSLWLVRTS
ncbi:MAG TPA: class I SAM-dependent methyltransferase [Geminicoccus sp.]|jgi:predicted O-methyltransferase YrrM|uniref:class I SAM-dependent methyltransferase n=1 Tax=Geminicoccus sp. TaxID=2024832 RepID=UPI002E32AABE|nr:class I SAM-dependent methyltransferase [Geminicoccus sp.]HEX2527125.1 class I SAM-dependent methyltransferase [Geminicoccus sp.]